MNFVEPSQLISGAILAAIIALVAGAARFLSFSGALAALIIGFCIFGFGGMPFTVPLLVFFFSSSLLSRFGRSRKAAQQDLYEKSSTRDALQVIANGAIPALLAVIAGLGVAWLPPRRCMLIFLGALAAVNADTWATEIGGLSPNPPLLVTTFKRVQAGTSGAISPLGLFAALLGAAAIVAAGWLGWVAMTPIGIHAPVISRSGVGFLQSMRIIDWHSHALQFLWPIDAPEMLAVGWAGFVAAFGDSVLGASVQAQYRCTVCRAITERRTHCGRSCSLIRGFRWLNNDTVNLATSIMGALFAWILLSWFAYPL